MDKLVSPPFEIQIDVSHKDELLSHPNETELFEKIRGGPAFYAAIKLGSPGKC